jgi:hypothetical protein
VYVLITAVDIYSNHRIVVFNVRTLCRNFTFVQKRKKDRHSESVRPFGWNVNGKDNWYLLFVLYCMQFASAVNNFFAKKESHPPKGERLSKPDSPFNFASYCS